MTAATRLGQAWRRLAANSSITTVRESDEERDRRNGATSVELNQRFVEHVEAVETRVPKP